MSLTAREDVLREELDRFVSAGSTPRTANADIAASWERSVLAGLQPERFDVPYVADVDDDSQLVWAAAPIIDRVAEDLEDSGIGLLLTNERGHVIYRRSRERAVTKLLDRIELAPGFLYSETHVGTNAIGTAIAQEASSVVNASEHFAEALVRMSCAASPVTDAAGHVLGVVDLTSTSDNFSPLMLPLAKRAAWEIRQRLSNGEARIRVAGWAVLTASERRVASLVVEGLTNRQVARRLLVRPRTIDSQLRSIFRKLGVRSRLELVRVTELAASRSRILAAADDARRQIERDLHDGLQQQLVTLGLRLNLAEESIPAADQHVKNELAQLAEALRDVLDNVRDISRGIHPAILSEAGLAPALKALARRSPIPVKLDVGFNGRLAESIELGAYYVASEALANVAKHANATAVNVSIETRDGALYLSVRDDGVGGANPGGTGLVGLRERVEVLGGALRLLSPRGNGTLVQLELPLTL
jgi:signal transduction histidine kinase